MTDVELDNLERKAKAATQGEWKIDAAFFSGVSIGSGEVHIAGEMNRENAVFMLAANPQAVLALVAEVRRLRELLSRSNNDD